MPSLGCHPAPHAEHRRLFASCTFCSSYRMGFWRACCAELQFAVWSLVLKLRRLLRRGGFENLFGNLAEFFEVLPEPRAEGFSGAIVGRAVFPLPAGIEEMRRHPGHA